MGESTRTDSRGRPTRARSLPALVVPARRSKTVDRRGACELRRRHAFDEVAAPYPTGIFHGPQHWIDAGEAPFETFEARHRTGEDSVAVEELVGDRGASGRAIGGRNHVDPAPASFTPGRNRSSGAETARPAKRLPLRPPHPAPDRLERVVGEVSPPDECPEDLQRLLGESPAGEVNVRKMESAARLEEGCPRCGRQSRVSRSPRRARQRGWRCPGVEP